MSRSVSEYIQQKISERKAQGNFRSLFLPEGTIDFFSNDYLGIASDNVLHDCMEEKIRKLVLPKCAYGSTGSRLLSGNSLLAVETEAFLADIHQAEAALLFPSGYMANVGVLSALPYKNATIVYDELVHASMLDGIKMSKAASLAFRHNSLTDLEEKLAIAKGLKFIAIEALYSMDGDFAPLQEMIEIAERYDAAIILDEAHSSGVYGKRGEGRAQSQKLHHRIFFRIHTFGKAPGVHGAVAFCDHATKDFLVNYCRPLIFSTAMPGHALVAIQCSYEYLASGECEKKRQGLMENIQCFHSLKHRAASYRFADSLSAIQTLFVPGNEKAKNLAQAIRKEGFEVRAILSPTVPAGTERIRICLHSFNTTDEIVRFINTLSTLQI
jgi:8-amino-7-oxononanoate synthase